MRKFIKFREKFHDRLFVLFFSTCFIFIMLAFRLFYMQIINGDIYLKDISLNIIKKINITAPRGIIYDRYGRAIAKNKFVYNVKFDPSLKISNLNEGLYNLINLFEKNNENYIDDFPITESEPFEFNFNNENEKKRWQKDMNINKNFDAAQTFNYLKKFFSIKSEDNKTARKIISLRTKLYLQRYRQYRPVDLAINVSQKTIVAIEEESEKYPATYIESEPVREYINAECFSNLVGYLGNVTEKELSMNKDLKSYNIIGKAGLEKSFEDDLCGTEGELLVQVDNIGRRVGTINKKNAIAGNNLFLTIDKNLQEKSYKILEKILSNVLKLKLSSGAININNLFASMLDTNALSIRKIFESPDNSYSYQIKLFVLKKNPEVNYLSSNGQKEIRKIISDGIKNRYISIKTILLVMYEQGVIYGDFDYIKNSDVSKIFYDKLETGEISPKLFNFDPCTGSVIVLDVDTGEVLTAVGYPSYDNNKLNLSSEYYNQILTAINTPMVDRPFMEPRAPGSTFKMITGLTGLQDGVINPNTLIYDETTFKKAGIPYSKCWAKHSHGSLNISNALEVSCNYFFFETAYRLGNSKNNNLLDGIKKLNFYMREFGLDERTGVEIGELYDFSNKNTCHISGPEYKKNKNTQEKLIWYDGDTIRTAIGQSKNNYTAANMAKYINTLASGGKRFKLYLASEIRSQDGEVIKKNSPKLEKILELEQKNLDAIYKGMLLVNEGSHGTGRAAFANFPIRVAGKTGTAQENNSRPDHTSYGGFAPFEKPRIAVYVLIPFGDTKLTTALSSQVAREIIKEYFKLDLQDKTKIETNCLIP